MMLIGAAMDMMEKLNILADAAKYDAACTSSGVDRKSTGSGIGNTSSCGICHSFSSDGRCISLLKVLQSNACIYDCEYCVNRRSNDTQRSTFTSQELATLTIEFYRRNYIEGLFLSSGIVKNPDYTAELMIETLRLLRHEYRFNGYIHVKAIPNADSVLISRLATLADRISINIELPSERSLIRLAPEKKRESILRPMGLISNGIKQNSTDLIKYNNAPKFAPAGQSTQMIVGASDESDYQILKLTAGLYKKYSLKRVFYSAYLPVNSTRNLPSTDTKPPLLREHRLYQADWLLRFYGFDADEILNEENDTFNQFVDPKCNWALNNLDRFPVEINKADYYTLLRVPGIGVRGARRIVVARRYANLTFENLKKMGIVLKRAQYFITCSGRGMNALRIMESTSLVKCLMDGATADDRYEQLSMFDTISMEDTVKCLSGQL